MCLSTVYLNEHIERQITMNNVQKIEYDGDYIILTDLLERKKKVKGTIKTIDLIENYIIIEAGDCGE